MAQNQSQFTLKSIFTSGIHFDLAVSFSLTRHLNRKQNDCHEQKIYDPNNSLCFGYHGSGRSLQARHPWFSTVPARSQIAVSRERIYQRRDDQSRILSRDGTTAQTCVSCQCPRAVWNFGPSITPEFIANRRVLSPSTGASRVVIFDHKTRHGPTNWHSLGAGNQSVRGPILRAHVDQSYAGAEFMVRWLLPDEAEELLKRRWQIINVCIIPPKLRVSPVMSDVVCVTLGLASH